MNNVDKSGSSKEKARINPLDVLEVLKSLLTPRGGITCEAEVLRVTKMMTKFSKKLVLKCTYLNILQATSIPLLDVFYKCGGWESVQKWLVDGKSTGNWPLIQEILRLLLLSPLAIEDLRDEESTLLIKDLSLNCPHKGVRCLAGKLCNVWEKNYVKSAVVTNSATEATQTPCQSEIVSSSISNNADEPAAVVPKSEGFDESTDESSVTSSESEAGGISVFPKTPIRITIRSGDQVLAKVSLQRPSQDSTDSEDNKPLSVIRKECLEKKAKEKGIKKASLDTERVDNKAITDIGKVKKGDVEVLKKESETEPLSERSVKDEDISEKTEDVNEMKEAFDVEMKSGVSQMGSSKESSPPLSDTGMKLSGAVASQSKSDANKEETQSDLNRGEKCDHDEGPDSKVCSDSDVEHKENDKTLSGEKKTKDLSKVSDDKYRKEKDKERGKSKKDKGRNEKQENDGKKQRSSSKSRSKDQYKDDHRSKDRHKASQRRENERDDKKEKRHRDRNSSGNERDQVKREQAEKDRATLEKVKPLSTDGIGKIPRKSSKAPQSFLDALGSADTDVSDRKQLVTKPKSRSGATHKPGESEEATKLSTISGKHGSDKSSSAAGALKRAQLDSRGDSNSAGKKLKLVANASSSDKSGGAKLVSPKRHTLSDDGGFMAALTASASAADSRKKTTRKRRSSESDPKDPKGSDSKADHQDDNQAEEAAGGGGEDASSPPSGAKASLNFRESSKSESEADPASSPEREAKKPRLEDEDEASCAFKDSPASPDQESPSTERTPPEEDHLGALNGAQAEDPSASSAPSAPSSETQPQEDYERIEVTFSEPRNSLKGVLVLRRAPQTQKKSVKWKAEDDLQEIFYFELDEKERVNVNTIKFQEMMMMEKACEREMFSKQRHNLLAGSPHFMDFSVLPCKVEDYLPWKVILIHGLLPPKEPPGCKSLQAKIQGDRESTIMPPIYHPFMIPETPAEPDPENAPRTEPKTIPLNDVTGSDCVKDYRGHGWPESVDVNPNFEYNFNMGAPMMGPSLGGPGQWVMGSNEAVNFGGGPMFPGPPNGPAGFGWSGMGSVGPGSMNMVPGDFGGPGPGGGMMMMGGPPNMGGGMHQNHSMMNMRGGGRGGRFQGGRGGRWSSGDNRSNIVCHYFKAGNCKHGKRCTYLHTTS